MLTNNLERTQQNYDTLKLLEPTFKVKYVLVSIVTLKIINFPFVQNGKLIVFRCPNIKAYYCNKFWNPQNSMKMENPK